MQKEYECHTIEQDGEVVFAVFDSEIKARVYGKDRVKSGLATDYYVKEIQA